jgi:tryptophanyl-tRNA synthetase
MTTETTAPRAATAAPGFPQEDRGSPREDRKTRKRILTGDRPTGRLHLGNYVGTLANRAALQGTYETYLLVADHHMLTTRLDKLQEIEQNIRDDVLDNLSVGVDPDQVTYFLQSLIPEIPELHLYFSMLVSVPRAQRIPTLKDQLRDHELAQPTYGLLGYPILQAADILIVKGDIVPVGKDQESHVELTREIARKFNETFAPVFPVPDALIPEVGLLPGIDGREKMGKSLDNAIFLADDPATIKRKVEGMYTDPNRIRVTDPGRVEGNPVFMYHDAFNDDRAEVDDLKERYRSGKVGDVEVKRRLVAALERFLAPIRERRARYERQPHVVDDILREGSERARAEAKRTIDEVREAMRLDYFGR